jgi:hypothetical protein
MAESTEYHIEKAEELLRGADAHPSTSEAYSHLAAAHIALASLLVSRQTAESTEWRRITE